VSPRPRLSPYLLLTLTALFWAGNWIIGRAIRHDVPPIALAFWRWMVAFGILLSIVFLDERLMFYHLAGISLIFGGIFLVARKHPCPTRGLRPATRHETGTGGIV